MEWSSKVWNPSHAQRTQGHLSTLVSTANICASIHAADATVSRYFGHNWNYNWYSSKSPCYLRLFCLKINETSGLTKNWLTAIIRCMIKTSSILHSDSCSQLLLDITTYTASECIDSDREVCGGSAVSCFLISSINYLHWPPDNPADTMILAVMIDHAVVLPSFHGDHIPSHLLKKHKHTSTPPW